MPVFDLPPERLVDLSDASLRELVARLCEAERERQGGHPCDVRWGGAQTAPDGGLDVVVEAGPVFEETVVLPRRSVGIQVKKDDQPPAKITREMCPGGDLRPSIKELANKAGAYLIASARADCSEDMLDRREAAMRSALSGSPNAAQLVTRFVDRNGLARWTSAHPSVAAWLRARLGLPNFEGWHPHGRWSSTPADEEDALICETGLRIAVGRDEPIEDLTEAIDAIRRLVRRGTKAVRIAGLSGVGKSRIVQALFEDIGADPLPASRALYADAGRDPDPSPAAMLDQLLARGQPAVLVIDNCPPDTHHALAQSLATAGGPIRLITVEYDVRADRPHETDVVRIEAEGPDIVRALLERRRPDLAGADARRLAELAQGNARLGLALAEAAPESGTLSSFEEDQLFERLFWQRGERNPELIRAAQVLSLVYSFDIEGEEEPDELTFLSRLTGLSRPSVYRHAVILLDRGLAQARGRWRAVLPHALANRLAAQALRELPWRALADAFADPDAKRLRSSFARRLAYLHDLPEARRIVLRWMEPNGPLYGPILDLDLLARTCHLAPRETLDAVQPRIAAMPTMPDHTRRLDAITRMLVRIAHDERYFEESCARLVELAIATEDQERSNVDQALEKLFGLYLSGTMARTETRITAARRCLASNDADRVKRGLAMTKAALRTGHWWSVGGGMDDARPDAWGWRPQTGSDVLEWYEAWINLASWAALSNGGSLRDGARKLLAEHLEGLWHVGPALHPRIEEIALALHADEPWVEGWNRLRQALYLERRRAKDSERGIDLEPLRRLRDRLEPSDLLSRAQAALRAGWRCEDEDDVDEGNGRRAAHERHQDRLEAIGRALAGCPELLATLRDDLFVQNGAPTRHLAIGLARGADASPETWAAIRDLFLDDPGRAPQLGVLAGFVEALDEDDPEAAETIRRECLTRRELRLIYPVFVPFGPLSRREQDRLLDVASEPEMSPHWFERFVWVEEYGVSDPDRVRLLGAMLGMARGADFVLEALDMLRHAEEKTPRSWPPELRAIGLNAVVAIIGDESGQPNHMRGHHLQRTVEACVLPGDEEAARRVLVALAEHARRRYGLAGDHDELLSTLAARAPETFLDHAFDDEDRDPLGLHIGYGTSPLRQIDARTIIGWCARGNAERWLQAARVIEPFGPRRTMDSDSESDTVIPQALALLDAAPDPTAVLDAYLSQLEPWGWSGSRAEVVARRLPALEELARHPNESIRATVSAHLEEMRVRVERMRREERERDQERDQRFE